MLMVVVDVDVIQVTCVLVPTVNPNHELGGIGWSPTDAEAPSLQNAPFVEPTLLTTTSVPAGSVPVTPPVVAVNGVPVVCDEPGNPVIDADTDALTTRGFAALHGRY
jgi:hypothetical protein